MPLQGVPIAIARCTDCHCMLNQMPLHMVIDMRLQGAPIAIAMCTDCHCMLNQMPLHGEPNCHCNVYQLPLQGAPIAIAMCTDCHCKVYQLPLQCVPIATNCHCNVYRLPLHVESNAVARGTKLPLQCVPIAIATLPIAIARCTKCSRPLGGGGGAYNPHGAQDMQRVRCAALMHV